MIANIYNNSRTMLAFGAFLLLVQSTPGHADAIYDPALNSAEVHSIHEFQTIEAGAALLSFILLLALTRNTSDRKYRSALQSMPCGVALFDREGLCLEILVRDRTPLEAGKSLHETLPEDSAAPIRAAIQKAFETGHSVNFEYMLTGQEKWYEGSAEVLGKDKALCICHDITARKLEAIALSSENESLNALLQSVGNGVIATDSSGLVTYLNPEAEKLTGWKSVKAAGLPLSTVFRILVESSREPAENPAFSAMRSNGTSGTRSSPLLIGKDGSEHVIDLSAALMRRKDGSQAGVSIAFHDISFSKHLLWQAGHDALTGLLNRVLLHDRLMHSMASVKRQGKLLAVLFIDLDKFKSINDSLGHTAGDMLLKEVALRLKNAIRAEDTAARIGGDEFVVLQEASDKREVRSSLDRIMSVMHPPFVMDGKSVEISLSIGVVLYPENDAEPETLLRQADMAMYHAKQSGRDQYRFFDAGINAIATENHERLKKIEAALKQGELCLHYQPKIDLKSGRVIGFEALIRWNAPGLDKPVLPTEFLPAVQDTPAIVEIGTWVIHSVLGQMQAWQEQGMAVDVSVNIASRQLHDPGFLDTLRAAFETFPDVSSSRLELEILETTAIADFQFIQKVLAGCREIGLKLALDDFGTGYASLSYLKNLPVDRLKIDRSFVSDLPENQDNIAIIRSIVSMSRIFRREVIAEGLESPLQGKELIRMGCRLAQGFGIAKPMPSEAVPEWIGQWPQKPDWVKSIH